MNSSPELFNLIKSLTPAEKRNFLKMAGQYSSKKQSNYVRFFHYFCGQQMYDHEKFKVHCESKGLVKNYSSEKNYLYKKILQSLSMLHHQYGSDIFHQEFVYVGLLFQKGLYNDAFKKLDKMKNGKIRDERFASAIEVINYLQKSRDKYCFSNPKAYWKSTGDEKTRLINYLSAIDQLSKISEHAEELVLSCVFGKNQSVLDKLSGYSKESSMLNQKYDIRAAKLYHYRIQALHAYSINNINDARDRLNEAKDYWLNQDKKFQKRNIASLLKILQYLLTLDLKSGNPAAFCKTVDFCKGIFKKYSIAAPMCFSILVRPLLVYYKLFKPQIEFESHLRSSEENLRQFEKQLEKEQSFIISYCLGLSCFYLGHFDSAFTHFYNCTKSINQLPFLKEIQLLSKIFCAIIHAEKGPESYSIAAFKSIEENLKEQSIQSTFPLFLTKTIKKISRSNRKSPMRANEVDDLVHRLNYIDRFHNNCIYLGMDELRNWALGIIENKTSLVINQGQLEF